MFFFGGVGGGEGEGEGNEREGRVNKQNGGQANKRPIKAKDPSLSQ